MTDLAAQRLFLEALTSAVKYGDPRWIAEFEEAVRADERLRAAADSTEDNQS